MAPNFLAYHRSLSDEIHALKNRVKNLVPHNATSGAYKEAVLRAVLRRHLPEFLAIGHGFVVTSGKPSTQVDLLIVDKRLPTLFRDGDLMFVTPDCVRAVIEVKTRLNGQEIAEEVLKLARIGDVCAESKWNRPWLGLFLYEGTKGQCEDVLDALERSYHRTESLIDCVAVGRDCFIRLWKWHEREVGDDPDEDFPLRWRAYSLAHLAASYFVGNIVEATTQGSIDDNSFAWYPLADGKAVHRISERCLPDERGQDPQQSGALFE